MPFPLHLFNPQNFARLTPRRVSLVRFVRAIDDVAVVDASDPDDRGFDLDPTFANAHGPAFGISGPDGATTAQQCRIRVIRDRLEPAVPLFPTIADPALVTQVSPAPGAVLNPSFPGDDTLIVRAARAPATDTSTTLSLHFGSATGPVVGECTIRVLPIIPITVKGHLVTINGGAPSSNRATFDALLLRANIILAAAGIKLTLDPVIQPENISGLRTANTISLLNSTAHFDSELSQVMRLRPLSSALNVYIVGNIDQISSGGNNHNVVAGVGISSVRAASRPPSGTYVGGQTGFVTRDPDDLDLFGWVFAHELGHVLTLEHYNNKQVPNVQSNNWSQRNIMYNHVNVFTGNPVNSIGYGIHGAGALGLPVNGRFRSGAFIGIKQFTRIFQSNQSFTMRTAANNGTFLIV